MIIVCAVVAVLFAADYWTNAGKVYRGVEVGGVDVGGMTAGEARDVIRERSSGALSEIRVENPTGGEDFTYAPSRMGVDYNVDGTVERAFAYGREGGLGKRISERFTALYSDVEVEPRYSYNPAEAEEQVARIASDLDSPAQDAGVEVIGSTVDVTDAKTGYRTDREATLDAIDASVKDMSGVSTVQGEALDAGLTTGEADQAAAKARQAMDGQLTLTGGGGDWTVSPAAIGSALTITKKDGDFEVSLDRDAMRQNLEPAYAALEKPAVEASYNVDGTNVSVSPSRQGQAIQSEKLLDEIQRGLFGGQRSYGVPLVVDRPELTTARAEAMKPTKMLGEYSTNYLTYDDTPGRVTNLQIGSNAVNGQLVAPGETFSFNALASQYDYEPSKVIIEGKVDEADGGGLCQVSSTLYMAANLAGLEEVERYPHYAELPYIRPGLDATVWFGALDLKFRNNTDGYVLISEGVNTETGDVTARIYGVPQNVQVDMSSKKVAEYTNAEGKPTTDWVTYKTVTRDGKVEYDGVLHKDTYEYLEPADS